MAEAADGLLVFVKRECPTCVLVEPVLAALAQDGAHIVTQDDPAFPAGVQRVIDDRALERSFAHDIEIVPTLLRLAGGREVGRAIGWHREEWRALSGLGELGTGLPAERPGCGSLTQEPGIAEQLALRHCRVRFQARAIELGEQEDAVEAAFARGWSDGLPVVPPTRERVYRMLQGASRQPEDVLGLAPPNLVPCTVEKVAINAVMAGCRPDYFPVVLAVIEAALTHEFCMHGLLCTTMFSGPMVIVNGPVRRAIGMNWGVNALGQGNRANATIGRALQLVIRNVGGGLPGGIDRATLGNPGKYTFCFAEDEDDTLWEPLSVEHGLPRGASAVTLFAGDGVQPMVDQKSRTPDSLARSFAACLTVAHHPKLALGGDAFLIVSPEHYRVFRAAGWSKQRTKDEINRLLLRPGAELMSGVGGMAEGLPARFRDQMVPKFRQGGLKIVRAGGQAGLFSAIVTGWAAAGDYGSSPVTKEVRA
ncbi:MAG: thioredoxin [Alphaproteobacteria bacterium]|nr:thioredoxin [Alphaproteobacteria bacterium]